VYISSFPKDRTAPIKILIICGCVVWDVVEDVPESVFTHWYYKSAVPHGKIKGESLL